MNRIALLALGFCAAPAALGAFVFDDFVSGGWSWEVQGLGQKSNVETGLDRNHTPSGDRTTSFDVYRNERNALVLLRVGGGGAEVTASRSDVSSRINFRYGIASRLQADLSFADRIEVDYTSQPPQFIATTYEVFLLDEDGVVATSSIASATPTGIRFLRRDFTGPIDWSRIKQSGFSANWVNDSRQLRSYRFTEFRAVPEPGLLLAAGAGLAAVCRRRPPKRG